MSSTAERVTTTTGLAKAGRAAWHCAVVALFGFSLVGCQSGLKKSKDAGTRSPVLNEPNQPFWNEPGSQRTPLASVPTSNGNPADGGADAGVTGILAGRIVGSRDRVVGVSYVQVQPAEDRPGQAPVDVETTPDGHFYVRGLVPGQAYRLTARTRQDGKVAVGEAVARPPDARLLIAVSEDFAGPSNPSPSGRSLNRGPPTGVAPIRQQQQPPTSAELLPPRPNGDYYPSAPAAENFASSSDTALIPKASIAAPGLPGTTAQPLWEPPSSNGPVPECLVSGGRVLTLRLKDTDGKVWDFSQHQGKLVLIDFWGSWCTPCLRAIPELTRIQQQYRTRGLEVIGIACEDGSPGENVDRVRAVRRRIPSINYRLLMAGEPNTDPVRAQFRPTAYPTLMLVDTDGTILWRGVGGQSIGELESMLRSRLSH